MQRAKRKMQNFEGGEFFLSPFLFFIGEKSEFK